MTHPAPHLRAGLCVRPAVRRGLASVAAGAALSGLALAAQAQTGPAAWPAAVPAGSAPIEQARVLQTTPIVQQQRRQQQSCGPAGLQAPPPRSGAGAVTGALIGGAVGHAIGQAGGAAVGAVAGAVIGDRAEAAGSAMPVREGLNCTVTETVENVSAFSVVYEYGGRTYTVVLPADPGPTVPVQVVPVGAAPAQPAPPAAYVGMPGPAPAPAAVGYPTYVPYPVYGGYRYWVGPPVVVGIGWGYPVYRPHRHWR